ncbi:hypothetical protein STCU_09987 [Strigomonas culicis]|uniref:Uncharacterized protein n=1 Tax=Strigomonas culicis TaxID=28005 RepID=S9TNW8_9TRYP|nr:hypothetical protein STCU_09987 [Strigomonas culicis]|eukprot:EPY18399.1 hypothetical protein STCU_09987 [Strigomonas culicis]
MRFAEPLEAMSDGEVAAARRFLESQVLEEIACHHVGQLVTSLRVQPYNPTGGADPALAVRILFYATALGAVGAYSTFVTEEDGALGAYLRQLLPDHMTRLLAAAGGRLAAVTGGGAQTPGLTAAPVHHVVEGDLVALLRGAPTDVFSARAKAALETELARLQRVEAAQRRQLALPPRKLPPAVRVRGEAARASLTASVRHRPPDRSRRIKREA